MPGGIWARGPCTESDFADGPHAQDSRHWKSFAGKMLPAQHGNNRQVWGFATGPNNASHKNFLMAEHLCIRPESAANVLYRTRAFWAQCWKAELKAFTVDTVPVVYIW